MSCCPVCKGTEFFVDPDATGTTEPVCVECFDRDGQRYADELGADRFYNLHGHRPGDADGDPTDAEHAAEEADYADYRDTIRCLLPTL